MFSKRLKHLVYKYMYGGSVPHWVVVASDTAIAKLQYDSNKTLPINKVTKKERHD